jgi:hypothetical protein
MVEIVCLNAVADPLPRIVWQRGEGDVLRLVDV